MKISVTCLMLAFFISLIGCTSYKKIPYFQNIPDSSYVYHNGETIDGVKKESITIKPDDILAIKILLKDGSDALMPQNTINPTPTPIGNNANQSKNIYRVNEAGFIQIPIIGNVEVTNLTLLDIRKKIGDLAMITMKNPIVQVELDNFTITVLGEVNKPGTYTIVNKDKCTIVDVLGLAGDLNIGGKRNNIMLIRDLGNGKKKIGRFNLQSTDIFNSPFYNLQQNDVVYIEPTKFRASAESFQKISFVAGFAAILSVLVSVIALSK